ncbi:MAG: LacI family DNA-binding transcriptional regulator [Burkholderiaceae bacterium]
MSQPATIADIARQAGVGTATVDRVLNRRPGVNADTVQRVLQVATEMGPLPVRGRPRQSHNFRFSYVLPADGSPFAELLERQIAQAAGDFRHRRITEITHQIDAADANQFAARLAEMVDSDGIALMAPDLPAVKLAINALVRAGVHVVTLFSDVAGSMRETHIGADNRAAGRTAGLLLARMASTGRDTFLLSSQATRLSAQIERRIGFAQVLEERFPKLRVLRTPDLPGDDTGAAKALQRFLKKQVDLHRVAGIYNVGSGSVGVVKALESVGLAGSVGVTVHDLNEKHQNLLRSGAVSYVLHQDVHYCVLTAAHVLRALCENVRGALNVVQPRVEILTAENLH